MQRPTLSLMVLRRRRLYAMPREIWITPPPVRFSLVPSLRMVTPSTFAIVAEGKEIASIVRPAQSIVPPEMETNEAGLVVVIAVGAVVVEVTWIVPASR